jgi:hypothetical protein
MEEVVKLMSIAFQPTEPSKSTANVMETIVHDDDASTRGGDDMICFRVKKVPHFNYMFRCFFCVETRNSDTVPIIDFVELKIGERHIERHPYEFLLIKSALANEKPALQNRTVWYFPLRFWFCDTLNNVLRIDHHREEDICMGVKLANPSRDDIRTVRLLTQQFHREPRPQQHDEIEKCKYWSIADPSEYVVARDADGLTLDVPVRFHGKIKTLFCASEHVTGFQVYLNGHSREDVTDPFYYNAVRHLGHSDGTRQQLPPGTYMFDFGGFCNFDRIDAVKIRLEVSQLPPIIRLFASRVLLPAEQAH